MAALPTKDEIRKEMRRRRRALAAAERARLSDEICERLLGDPEVAAILTAKRPIAVYLPSAEEVDVTAFISAALAASVPVWAPKWTGCAYALAPLAGLAPPQVVTGPHGIREPAEFASAAVAPALWLVPGLAFTRTGKRIGYGGGWYDRLLSAAGDALVLGVAFPFQICDDLPVEPHDRPLDRNA